MSLLWLSNNSTKVEINYTVQDILNCFIFFLLKQVVIDSLRNKVVKEVLILLLKAAKSHK